MRKATGYAAFSATERLKPYEFMRRSCDSRDVDIDIMYCGICHSDIHQARNEWKDSIYPMVPGHEIVGRVAAVGKGVTKHEVGDLVGVGCFVHSCRTCAPCKKGFEQYCRVRPVGTYNSLEYDNKTVTQGGYSTSIVVNENFVLKIPKNVSAKKTAPLLCAGITTYSPLKHWKVGPGSQVGVIGLGGLGHMAVKLAAAMGADVTVFSRTDAKKKDALAFGAKDFVTTQDGSFRKTHKGKFELILNTVSSEVDLDAYLSLLDLDGTLVMLGVPPTDVPVSAGTLIGGRKNLSGSLVGGIAETQEMLNFCAEKNIFAEVETVTLESVNEAYERMMRSDVKYRFVLDLKAPSL